METALATLDITTLQTYLSEALHASHKLALGASAASIGTGTDSISFTQANQHGLAGYISQLQNAIAIKSGSGGRKPILIAPYG